MNNKDVEKIDKETNKAPIRKQSPNKETRKAHI